MRSMQLIDRLDLYEQSFLDEDIDPERRIETEAFKLDVDWPLAGNLITHSGELRRQHRLIDRLQKPRTKLAMQADRQIEYVAAYLVDVPHPLSPRLCVSARIPSASSRSARGLAA